MHTKTLAAFIIALGVAGGQAAPGTGRPEPGAQPAAGAGSGDVPPAALFTVYPTPPPDGARMTPYLRFQLDRAWEEDAARVAALDRVATVADLTRLQRSWRQEVLAAIGGLPTDPSDTSGRSRPPLNARIVGTIQADGYRIEKVIFESLPGIHVTALVYVPAETEGRPPGRRPAVLVACGHSVVGKAFVNYQQIAGRLARRGYVVICWDPVGQGERSQFWDAAHGRSRYNLICGEHAVLGNLAVLAGASLTRWMVWDGMRAVDYLLTRGDVDPARLAITGTSGGGFQSAWIGALDPRIAVIAPSAYISALPMRMANRIFDDPDTDPEQDSPGLLAHGIDHASLLLLAYPRPIHVSAAIKDFFPIEGTRKTLREVSAVYRRFGHADLVKLKEGYHGHAYSDENQASAFAFIDRFLKPSGPSTFVTVKTLDPAELRCTASGQVLVDLGGHSLVEEIQTHARTHNASSTAHAATPAAPDLTQAQTSLRAPTQTPTQTPPAIAERVGGDRWQDLQVDRFLLRHSGGLETPLVRLRRADRPAAARRVLLYVTLHGKAGPDDWSALAPRLAEGYEVVTFDLRATGETRMRYRVNGDDEATKALSEHEAATYPLASVMANHAYNGLLIGRPYFLDLLEDIDIATRYVRAGRADAEIAIMGGGDAATLARVAAQRFRLQAIDAPDAAPFDWTETVRSGRELWPIAYLLPGAAVQSPLASRSPQ